MLGSNVGRSVGRRREKPRMVSSRSWTSEYLILFLHFKPAYILQQPIDTNLKIMMPYCY